ncbi:MAG: molybdopterin-dependent oxidoreductase [Bacteroidetes bacterium]|nr:molybdopterin-dependent oxidoreductase [Bacteroidota bacterium]MBL6944187.1 molybdopterin-dependent oxidoreductase [Bacteroidales bacterium]
MKTRRDFIKISAAGAGVAALGLSTLHWNGVKAQENTQHPVSDEEMTPYPTYCEVCFWQCAGWTYVDKKGSIKKIIGNKEDPHCNGRLCPRGTGGIGMYYDEDRLKTPLIREYKENGEAYFRKASWDEALDYTAKKLQAVADEHGPECIALFNHGSAGKHFGTFLNALGSPNIAAPSFAQCRGPRETAWIATFGEAVGSPEPTDIRDTDCLVLIGSHLGENMHNGQVQEMAQVIDRGATIITVDPRLSTVAAKSKYWLPIKPATDLALLLAWIHVAIYEDIYNKEYVEKYTFGFDELKEHVKNMTPEWAYGITTIKPDIIRKTVREMANAAPSVIIHPGRHVTWYGDDTQRIRAVAILNALFGSWGNRGGFYLKESFHLPKPHIPPYPKPTKTWRDAYPGQFKLASLALSSGICDATIPTEDRACSFKAWIVSGTNLPLTLPDIKNTKKAMDNLDFMVVIDTMPMEVTGYADVILPECTYLERYDLIRTLPHREPNIALRMPAVKPKYDSKPAYWIAKQLANKMGLGAYFPFDDITDLLDWQLKQVGSSLEEMQRIGVKKFDRENGGLYFQKGEDIEFNTPTGKIELFSNDIAAEGFDPMPVYTPHPEPEQGFYRLIYGRAPMHTFSRTANNHNLWDLKKENSVWINPKVAKLWNLKKDQLIWLKNQDGVVSSFPIKVRITERIRWDSVYMVHGFGHTDKKLSRAYGNGANDSELITKVMVDPIMGGTGMRGNFVTFLTEKPAKEVEA